MIKHIKNNNGVALVIVMAILSVSTLVIFFMVKFLNSESMMIYNYICQNRAAQIAEAGADFAINEWTDYINTQHDPENCPHGELKSSNINLSKFEEKLDDKKGALEKALIDEYKKNNYSGNISITYDVPKTNLNPYDPDLGSNNTFTVDIEGEYDNMIQTYQVKLGYHSHGDVYSYKGSR